MTSSAVNVVATDSKDILAEKAESEVLACIGCNDCLLACPLTERQFVTIAELNAAVHLSMIPSGNVANFLSACTQCRQCVPACPADLSRADMVLFNKMKVEDQVPNHLLPLQVASSVTQSNWMLDGLAEQLTQLSLFAGATANDLRRLLLTVTLRQLVPGEDLCREGEFHERLYVVLAGSVEQTSLAGPAGPVRILVLGPGSFFGEMAVIADQAEPFTVTSLEMSVVLEIPKAAVHRLMQHSPAFRGTMDELYRRRALFNYARQPNVLGGMPEHVVADLLSAAEVVTLKSGEYLFRQGDPPRDFYLVRSGFLRVLRQVEGAPRVVVYFREGDLFGLMPLLFSEGAQSFGVQATSRADVIRVPGAHLGYVFGRYPGVRDQLGTGALEMERVARSTELGPAQAPANPLATSVHSTFEALVEAGVTKGRAVLAVDQNRCTNCQNCVDACGRRHGHSRLKLRGLQLDNLMFPTACRHCEDPVCLLCSVNGIVRLPSGEITIVEENCIGCGACAERCPYGNISMHPVNPPDHGFVFRLLDLISGGALRAKALRELDPRAPRKAVKCDLCAGHDDYACVTACPVGAAFRIDDPAALLGKVVIGLESRNRVG
ncbi:MAG TPA: cyclic nucleotide-binding domain-containing protein [Polyangiaceae bacterium]|nr:cyclic nucleotide-binding domain-containing protein [Polyangiaceae bacterium]